MNPTKRVAMLCLLLVGLMASPLTFAQSLEISLPFGTSPIVGWNLAGEADVRFIPEGVIDTDKADMQVVRVVRLIDDLSPRFFIASQSAQRFPLVVISGGPLELELEEAIVQSIDIDTSVSPAMETISLVYNRIQYSFGATLGCWDFKNNEECP